MALNRNVSVSALPQAGTVSSPIQRDPGGGEATGEGRLSWAEGFTIPAERSKKSLMGALGDEVLVIRSSNPSVTFLPAL